MTADLAARGLTGVVDADCVHPLAERVPDALLERLRAVGELSATVSDILDGLGVQGAIGASELPPTMPDRAIVGTVITVRKEPQRQAPSLHAAAGEADMGEIEGANQCEPGDVLVIQGLPGVSAMGGLMATMAVRQGAAGAIVDGGVRDVGHARSIGFPMWSRDITPVTGKFRSEVVEVGGRVTIAGMVVHAGDVVIADETGIVFVPRELVADVVERVEQVSRAEEGYRAALAGDLPLDQLVRGARAGAGSEQ